MKRESEDGEQECLVEIMVDIMSLTKVDIKEIVKEQEEEEEEEENVEEMKRREWVENEWKRKEERITKKK